MISQSLVSTSLSCCMLKSMSDGVSRRKDGVFARNCTGGGVNGAGGAAKIAPRKGAAKGPSKWAYYGGRIPSILQALDSVPDIDEALGPWEEFIGNKERTIILSKQVDWERAVEIFEWFKGKGGHELNVIHYNVMLRILGRSRKWGLMGRLWLEMQEKGIEPKNSTYSTLIGVFSKGGLNKEALVWFSDMVKQGLKPDEITMLTIFQTYKKTGQFAEAHEFFRKWSLVRGDDPTSLRCHNVQTFNTLIDTYGKAGLLKEASDAFANMLNLGVAPDTVTFNTMIHICGSHGRMDDVAALMEKMEELRCPPDSRTYSILVFLYAKGDEIEKATWHFLEMKKVGLVPDLVGYRTLLYAYSIRGMVREAESLLVEMEEGGYEMDEYTQSALTRMYVDVGAPDQAWSWFVKFQPTMTSDCYAANIDAFGVHGHLSYAEKVFAQCLSSKQLSVSVFNVMIKAYGIAKSYEKVCDAFVSMEKYGISPDKCTFVSVIQILCVAELPMKAITYARKMHLSGFVDDCFPYSAVISGFARLGDLEMAEEMFKEMVGLGIKPDILVFGVLINAFAEAGNIPVAEKYVNLMKSAGYSANHAICNTLIKLYTKHRCLKEAHETFMEAQLLDDGPEAFSSNCMIELYAQNNMIHEAEKVFADLKRSEEATEFSYAMMLCLYKNLGKFKQGIVVAKEMLCRNLVRDVLSYSIVIELFALNGRLTDAVKIFQQMLDSGLEPNDSTFKSLGSSLIHIGLSKDAVNHLESARRKNCKYGLMIWLQTLQLVLPLEDPGFKIERKFESLPQT